MSNVMTTGPAALEGCLEVCDRCRLLVEAVGAREPADADRLYGLIGPHLRHCLDHFTSLLRGLAAGAVDYDARDREPALEREPGRFLAALERTVVALHELAGSDPERPLRVLQQVASDAPPVELSTTLERELAFLSSHTIHHLALIAELVSDGGLAVHELGVAFSTAAYRDRLDGKLVR